MKAGTARLEFAATAQVQAITRSRPANWELDAALAVLNRAREELAALPAFEHVTEAEAHHAAQRRLLSAQQLVSRICGKMQ